MTSQHLRPWSLCEAIADRVRELILNHEMPPGTAVSESDLATAYGVSRTPVREALKLLHHEGLLTAHARRGMSVTVLTPAERQEAQQLHRLLMDYGLERSAQADAGEWNPLLARMLELAERHLRLAYGPGFQARGQDGQAPSSPESSRP